MQNIVSEKTENDNYFILLSSPILLRYPFHQLFDFRLVSYLNKYDVLRELIGWFTS